MCVYIYIYTHTCMHTSNTYTERCVAHNERQTPAPGCHAPAPQLMDDRAGARQKFSRLKGRV